MTKVLEQKARRALEFVLTSGIDEISSSSEEALKYGLKKGLFAQEDVVKAQIKFREHSARQEFGYIPTSGIDDLDEKGREALQYGLAKGLFTQEQVDKAQKTYENTQK